MCAAGRPRPQARSPESNRTWSSACSWGACGRESGQDQGCGPAKPPVTARLVPRYLAQCCCVLLRLEANQQFAPARLQDGPFDHRRLPEHQAEGFCLGDAVLLLVREFLEGCSCAVEQRLPTDLLCPLLKLRPFDARNLIVVERIIDAMLVEPGTRLLHRVAVLADVDGDRHAYSHSIVPGGFEVTS